MGMTPQLGTPRDHPTKDILGYQGIDQMSLKAAFHYRRGEKDVNIPTLPRMPWAKRLGE